MRRTAGIVLVTLGLAVAAAGGAESKRQPAPTGQIVLATDDATYVIGRDGKNLGFRDNRSGKDYCDARPARALAVLKKGAKQYAVTGATHADGRISLAFQPPGIMAVVKVVAKKHYFVWEVESISDPDVDELSLLNLPVTVISYGEPIGDLASGAHR